MSGLRRLWRGELPLADAFWSWAVLGGLAVNLTTTVLFLILLWADHRIAAFVVGYGLSVPYNVLAVVCVWRSAERYTGDRRWADLARIVTVIAMVLLSLVA